MKAQAGKGIGLSNRNKNIQDLSLDNDDRVESVISLQVCV